MDDRNSLCELHRLADLDQLSELERALASRGIEADIWGDARAWSSFRGSRESRLMVRCRDLVYARWVAAGLGLDTWPEEEGAGEAS